MPLTDRSDVYVAVHERGINLILKHLRAQRPSLFNYATPNLATTENGLCRPIDRVDNGAPSVTLMDPLPVPGSQNKLLVDYLLQIADLAIDFHPQSIALPPELRLAAQQFSVSLTATLGIGKPQMTLPLILPGRSGRFPGSLPAAISVTTNNLICFTLGIFGVGHVEIIARDGVQFLVPRLDALEIVDIEPTGLEDASETIGRLFIDSVLLPATALALDNLSLKLGDLVHVKVVPANVQPNPSIADDQMAAFIDLEF